MSDSPLGSKENPYRAEGIDFCSNRERPDHSAMRKAVLSQLKSNHKLTWASSNIEQPFIPKTKSLVKKQKKENSAEHARLKQLHKETLAACLAARKERLKKQNSI